MIDMPVIKDDIAQLIAPLCTPSFCLFLTHFFLLCVLDCILSSWYVHRLRNTWLILLFLPLVVSWMRKAEPFEFIGPRVSNASDWYLSYFRSAAPSAAEPAADDVAWMYDSVKVLVSQVIHFPAYHGICVRPSGRSPSGRRRPNGSLTAGTLLRPRAHETRSFRVWWRDVLPSLRHRRCRECLWDRPWRRMAVTLCDPKFQGTVHA